MARISVDQACSRLGISKSTFYGHVRAGRVSIYKDGARSFVHEAGLIALEGGEPAPMAETFEQRLERIARMNGIAAWDYGNIERLREDLEREDREDAERAARMASWDSR